MEENTLLVAEKLSKRYVNAIGAGLSILQQIDLSVNKNEFVTILGSSGSGKSTLMKMLAGIESPDSGSVHYAQSEKVGRNCAYIPTEASSLPWLSVMENIRLIFEMEGEKDRESADKKIRGLLETVGLEEYENHIPANKSLGFRFRISLARALAARPKVILIDDAMRDFSPEIKKYYYDLLNRIRVKEDVTFILATVNVTEALLLSDRILLLSGKPGRITDEFTPGRQQRNISMLASGPYIEIRNKIEAKYLHSDQ